MMHKKGWIAGIVMIAVIVLLFAGYHIYRYPAMFRNLSDNSLNNFLHSCDGLAVYGERRICGTNQIDGSLSELGLKAKTEDALSATPLPFEYETQELYAKRDENQIYGVVYISQNAGEKMPAVIFSHGFGGNYQVGAQYAEALAAKGYVVYCFDFCGGP